MHFQNSGIGHLVAAKFGRLNQKALFPEKLIDLLWSKTMQNRKCMLQQAAQCDQLIDQVLGGRHMIFPSLGGFSTQSVARPGGAARSTLCPLGSGVAP